MMYNVKSWQEKGCVTMINIIEKKKNGETLIYEEIEFVIKGTVNGIIPDYQLSALLMAICLKGMNVEETTNLALTMANSGDRADLSFIDGIKVDKHSTGGVGDSTTMITAPLVAACGGIVAKMSGRGLGHTGGTLDKLMSIPNMQIQFSSEQFKQLISKNKLAIVGQSGNLAPADKILYALRDVTSTVNNISLISSSIMSKKIAGGCDALVLDVKFGSGSFMKTYEDAQKLADIMVDIGKKAGVNTRAVLSDMNQPLGRHIGNALEVKEIISILKGENNNSRLLDLSLLLGSNMLVLSEIAQNINDGKKMMKDAISDGSGFLKFSAMVEAQGGDISSIENTDLLPAADKIVEIKSEKSGKIVKMNTASIGRSAMLLGAGRAKKTDTIDNAVGIVMNCELNDIIKVGDVICYMHINDESKKCQAIDLFKNSVIIKS